MQRLARAGACAVLAACVATGCGASQPRPAARRAPAAQSQPPLRAANDPQRASVSLLPRAELPLSVSEASSKRNHARCGPRVLFRRLATGVATSPRYGVEGGQVQQTVLLFRDAGTAARAFDRLTAASNRRCLQEGARSEVSVEAESPVGPVREQILNLEPHGQQSVAFRMQAAVYSAARTVAIDVLIDRVGRSVSSVSAIWTQPPQGVDFQEALLSRIVARLQRALA